MSGYATKALVLKRVRLLMVMHACVAGIRRLRLRIEGALLIGARSHGLCLVLLRREAPAVGKEARRMIAHKT